MKNYGIRLTLSALFILVALATTTKAQSNNNGTPNETLTIIGQQITLKGANLLAESARAFAKALNKEVAIVVVDAGGNMILLNRDNGTGPHNAEAARLKAYTSMSTKSNTLVLGRNAKSNPDTQNLATVSGLLLLGGGVPIFNGDKLIGAIGVAGGGGPENDDNIAKDAVASVFKNKSLKN